MPQLPVDVAAIDSDFYVWTGHKALGPTGIGVLHGRAEVLEAMPPFMTGGDMISRVELDHSTWNELPWKFEAGTSMIAEAVGLGAAVDYLDKIGMPAVRAHERNLTAHALGRLGELPGVSLFGPPASVERGGAVSFAVQGMHPHDISELVNRDNVCIRAGPSLRAAAHAPPGRVRHRPRQLRPLQHAGGRRRPDLLADQRL